MRVVVIGGGVVGLSIAWQLGRRHDVTVFDPAPGRGASWAAAGMLAPAGEAWHGEEALLRAGLDALARWPGFAADLAEVSGVDPWLSTDGTWLVGATDDDAAEVDRSVRLLEQHDIKIRRLQRTEVRHAEPALHPRLRTVVEVPDDVSVHNRRLLDGLLRACAARGVRFEADAADVAVRGGGGAAGVAGVAARSTGAATPADAVVVATGSRLADVGGVPARLGAACRPVKGQILRLGRTGPSDRALLSRTVRALVGGFPVYAVPRRDGEIVLGATTDEHGHDETVTVDAVHDLLRVGLAVVPGLRDCALVETLARTRPGTPDNRPLVGPTGVDGLLVAAGHYRGGVLLAPLTAAAIEAHLDRAEPPPSTQAFLPDRLEEGAR